jgi:hypothetical protein
MLYFFRMCWKSVTKQKESTYKVLHEHNENVSNDATSGFGIETFAIILDVNFKAATRIESKGDTISANHKNLNVVS